MKTVHNMKRSMRLVTVGLILAFGVGQEAWAAQQKEEDSVYRWGRWAVLSPAAGGEAYKAALTPDAANNARPGEAVEFQPEVASIGNPPVQPPIPIEPPIEPPIPQLPPVVVLNPPGQLPPIGDGRVRPPVGVTPNVPGTTPPIGDGRQR